MRTYKLQVRLLAIDNAYVRANSYQEAKDTVKELVDQGIITPEGKKYYLFAAHGSQRDTPAPPNATVYTVEPMTPPVYTARTELQRRIERLRTRRGLVPSHE